MKIENLMTRQVRTCAPGDNLNTAANVMWENDCGSVPVVDAAGRAVGMLTDRDVCMAAFFHGARLADLAVREVMARDLITLSPEASIHEALDLMRSRQVRRVPVVDGSGKLVGLLALADVASAWNRGSTVAGRTLRADDVALTLGSISRSRREAPRSVMVVEITPQPAPLKSKAAEANEPKSKKRAKPKKA